MVGMAPNDAACSWYLIAVMPYLSLEYLVVRIRGIHVFQVSRGF